MSKQTYNFIPLRLRIRAGQRMVSRKENQESVSNISRDLGISRSHLYRLEEKYLEDPSMEDKERTGRPRKIKVQMERRIVREIRQNPSDPSTNVTREVNQGLPQENQISTSTTKRIAYRNSLFAYRACRKPFLTAKHIRDRLEFAKTYQTKALRFWRHVLFADETSIQLFPQDTRRRVRRPPHARYGSKY